MIKTVIDAMVGCGVVFLVVGIYFALPMLVQIFLGLLGWLFI